MVRSKSWEFVQHGLNSTDNGCLKSRGLILSRFSHPTKRSLRVFTTVQNNSTNDSSQMKEHLTSEVLNASVPEVNGFIMFGRFEVNVRTVRTVDDIGSSRTSCSKLHCQS